MAGTFTPELTFGPWQSGMMVDGAQNYRTIQAGSGGAPSTITVLSSGGSSYSPTLSVKSSGGSSYTVTNAVLSSGGSSYTVI